MTYESLAADSSRSFHQTHPSVSFADQKPYKVEAVKLPSRFPGGRELAHRTDIAVATSDGAELINQVDLSISTETQDPLASVTLPICMTTKRIESTPD